MRRQEVLILLILASVIFAIRLIDLDFAPFINDEPALQSRIDHHIETRTIPQVGLHGTRKADYGPVALWAYLPIRMVTDSVNMIVAWHIFLVAIAFVLLFFALRSSIGVSEAAWALLLAASSPYLFFYSRLAWDNTILIFTSALLVFYISQLERQFRDRDCLVLGALSGLNFMVHLMAIPLVVAAFLITAFNKKFSRSWHALIQRILLFAIGFFLVTAIYLQHTWKTILFSGEFMFTGKALLNIVPSVVWSMSRFLSTTGMEYFTDHASIDPGIVLRILATAMVFLVIRSARKKQSQSLLVRFTAIFFIMVIFYYYGIRPPTPLPPHYLMMAWWLMYVVLALFLKKFTKNSWLKNSLKGLIIIVVVSNLSYVLSAHSSIKQNFGTRGYHYGPAHIELERAISEACRMVRHAGLRAGHVDLSNASGVLIASLDYYQDHLPACKGVQLSSGQLALRFLHTDETSARLNVKR